jgi:hypothetical protein
VQLKGAARTAVKCSWSLTPHAMLATSHVNRQPGQQGSGFNGEKDYYSAVRQVLKPVPIHTVGDLKF